MYRECNHIYQHLVSYTYFIYEYWQKISHGIKNDSRFKCSINTLLNMTFDIHKTFLWIWFFCILYSGIKCFSFSYLKSNICFNAIKIKYIFILKVFVYKGSNFSDERDVESFLWIWFYYIFFFKIFILIISSIAFL